MAFTGWFVSIAFALAGLYLIYVELGLAEKTFLLYFGILLLLPVIVKIYFLIKEKAHE